MYNNQKKKKKIEEEEQLQNNLLHHQDTWLTPCGKPQWQMLRARVKGKVLGNDMWNRGQTFEPPALQILHCAIVDRQHWTSQSEDTLFERGKKVKEEFYVTLQVKLENSKLQACHGKQNVMLYERTILLKMLNNTKGQIGV